MKLLSIAIPSYNADAYILAVINNQYLDDLAELNS